MCPYVCLSHLLSIHLHLFAYFWLIVSSAAAHTWHQIHFLRRLTGGGDATRQDRTGPWALQLNGANHLRPTDKYQHCWCQSGLFFFFLLLASIIQWHCPEAMPGDTAPCWVLNLWAKGGAKEYLKKKKENLVLYQRAIEKLGLRPGGI